MESSQGDHYEIGAHLLAPELLIQFCDSTESYSRLSLEYFFEP
jgi:hypothetical protein